MKDTSELRIHLAATEANVEKWRQIIETQEKQPIPEPLPKEIYIKLSHSETGLGRKVSDELMRINQEHKIYVNGRVNVLAPIGERAKYFRLQTLEQNIKFICSKSHIFDRSPVYQFNRKFHRS